jgi:hypothetical protein
MLATTLLMFSLGNCLWSVLGEYQLGAFNNVRGRNRPRAFLPFTRGADCSTDYRMMEGEITLEMLIARHQQFAGCRFAMQDSNLRLMPR